MTSFSFGFPLLRLLLHIGPSSSARSFNVRLHHSSESALLLSSTFSIWKIPCTSVSLVAFYVLSQISIFSSCHSPEHLYNQFLYLFTNIFLGPLKFLIIQRELMSLPLNWHCSCKLTHLYLYSVHLPLSITSLHPAVPTLLWQPSFLIWFIVLPAGSVALSME